jgi:protein-disulfide isomerase
MNAQGFPVLGDPDAPVQVVEYGSFDCPHCMVFHDTVMPALIERAAAGDISFTYVPIYGTGGVPNGLGAAEAALCAEQQGAFWPYHSALFFWQGQYGIEAFSADRLDAGAFNLGLDMAVWSECHQNMAVPKVLRSAAQSMRDAGVPGTPGLLVNGQLVNHSSVQAVNAAIDAALGAGQSAA